MRTFSNVVLFIVAFGISCFVASPARAEVNGDLIASAVTAATNVQHGDVSTETEQLVPASTSTGWYVNIGASTNYHCPTFGNDCSRHPVAQGSIFYKFDWLGGFNSLGVWGSLGAGLLADETNWKWNHDRNATLPYIGKFDFGTQVGYDQFNPTHGSFGQLRTSMLDFELYASKTYDAGTWHSIRFEIKPGMRAMYFLGFSHAAFPNYFGLTTQLTGTVRYEGYSCSAMLGKVVVGQGPYLEPWQFRSECSREFEDGLVASLSYGAARAGSNPETHALMLNVGCRFANWRCER